MFNLAGFHIPKQLAFKSGAIILEKLGLGADSIKPLGKILMKIVSFPMKCFFQSIKGHDKRLYTKTLNDEDMEKQEEYVLCDRDDYLGKHKF